MPKELETHPDVPRDEMLIDGVTVIDFMPSQEKQDTLIDGTLWSVIGTGESSDGKKLAVIKNPDNDSKTVIRRDHLSATERLKPSDAFMEIGIVAVSREVSYLHQSVERDQPRRIQVIHGAQAADR